MLESMNIRSTVPVYRQIENEVMFAIASGELQPGDRLPTVPELSERLKINLNTVANAYRDLAVMGYVTTQPWVLRLEGFLALTLIGATWEGGRSTRSSSGAASGLPCPHPYRRHLGRWNIPRHGFHIWGVALKRVRGA